MFSNGVHTQVLAMLVQGRKGVCATLGPQRSRPLVCFFSSDFSRRVWGPVTCVRETICRLPPACETSNLWENVCVCVGGGGGGGDAGEGGREGAGEFVCLRETEICNDGERQRQRETERVGMKRGK